MTEIGDIAAIQSKQSKKSDSIGYVIENTEIKIVDKKTNVSLGPNEEGELCIRVKTRMLNYYNSPEATEELFDDEGE